MSATALRCVFAPHSKLFKHVSYIYLYFINMVQEHNVCLSSELIQYDILNTLPQNLLQLTQVHITSFLLLWLFAITDLHIMSDNIGYLPSFGHLGHSLVGLWEGDSAHLSIENHHRLLAALGGRVHVVKFVQQGCRPAKSDSNIRCFKTQNIVTGTIQEDIIHVLGETFILIKDKMRWILFSRKLAIIIVFPSSVERFTYPCFVRELFISVHAWSPPYSHDRSYTPEPVSSSQNEMELLWSIQDFDLSSACKLF